MKTQRIPEIGGFFFLRVPRSSDNQTILTDYYEAGNIGHKGGKCHKRYGACPLSIFYTVDLK